MVTTDGESAEFNGKISDILVKLQPSGFLQTHKSYVVNESHVVGFNSTDITMENGLKVPVSGTYRKKMNDTAVQRERIRTKCWK